MHVWVLYENHDYKMWGNELHINRHTCLRAKVLFICEGEDKEDDQKQSILKPHLDLVRKTTFHLLELYKSFSLLSCFEDLVQRGSVLVWFFLITHFLYCKQLNVTSFLRIRWTGVREEAGACTPFLLYGQGTVNSHTAALVTQLLSSCCSEFFFL